jgi:hypothetical protein
MRIANLQSISFIRSQRTALKLRRAGERVVIQYPTRAASFKRVLGGPL